MASEPTSSHSNSGPAPAQGLPHEELWHQEQLDSVIQAAEDAVEQQLDPLWAAWQQAWRQWPEAIALSAGEQRWTYAQLQTWAQALALQLRRSGLVPGSIVVIHGCRSAAQLAAQLAVLACGGCVLPLEPGLPSARRALILAQTQVAAWLECSADEATEESEPIGPIIRVLDSEPTTAASSKDESSADESLVPALSQHNPAAALQPWYLLYTSGSSGQPKGVLGTRLGLWQRIRWQWQTYPYADGERVGWRTPLGFVDSFAEVWAPLLAGVPLVLLRDAQVRDLDQLIKVVEQEKISRLLLVPSLLDALLRAAPDLAQRWQHLRHLVCSGERWDLTLAQRAVSSLPACRCLNLYGMTEAAADATAIEVNAALLAQLDERGAALPIGRPMAQLQVQLAPSPNQQEGAEILLSGPALALAYYRQPGLTAAAFLPNPDPSQPGTRIYCSGDLGRWDENGQLHYLGRRDQQVQLRGQRVELGEIEQAALQHPAVALAVAQCPAAGAAAGALVLSLALAPDAQLTAQGLREFLQPRLAAYMMPALIEIREQLPLLHNGKIDRQALAAARLTGLTAGDEPATDNERELALIWQEILRCGPAGRSSSFFALGGNSLTAALVVSRIRAHWGVACSMADFFDHPQLDQQAALLAGRREVLAGDVEIVEF